jgi:hypothetical protein
MRHYLAIALISLVQPVFAQESLNPPLAEPGPRFEQLVPIESAKFLPAGLMEGRLHKVQPMATNDGLYNTYAIETATEIIDASGTVATAEYIRELYAIDHLRKISAGEEFGKAIERAGKAKVQSAVGVVRDPIGTVKNIPKGASRFFGRVGESLKSGKSEGEDSALASLAGVSKAKAQLAAKLGVDPYSGNQVLQEELNRVARAMAGGGLLIDAASAAVGGGAGAVVSAVGLNKTLQDTLVNSTPEDLRIINRKKLFAMGLDREAADEFLMHPHISPWHESIITDALARIGANPTAFLAAAKQALTPEDARYYQRLAQVLAKYHEEKAPIRDLVVRDGLVCALDRDGTLVVPLSCDQAIWTARASQRADYFSQLGSQTPQIKSLAVWVDGRVSDRFKEELTKRKVSVTTDVLGWH